MNTKQAFLFFFCIFFTYSFNLQAQVSFSGYGATGFRWYDRNPVNGYNNKTYYEGKLQADIVITKYVDAQLDFRGNSDDHTVELREFSAKLDYFDDIKIKVGNLKKPFGTEQFIETDERDPVDRSYVERELTEIGYGGRSVMIMVYNKYKKKLENKLPVSYYCSLYKDNSNAAGVILRGEYYKDVWNFGAGLVGRHTSGVVNVVNFAASADVSYNSNTYVGSLEVLYAGDPLEEMRRRDWQIPRKKVYALGVNSTHKLIFDTQKKVITSIQPFLLLGCYAPDTQMLVDAHTFQTLIGVNFYFEPDVRLRLNGDLLMHKILYTDKYDTYDSRVTVELQVRF